MASIKRIFLPHFKPHPTMTNKWQRVASRANSAICTTHCQVVDGLLTSKTHFPERVAEALRKRPRSPSSFRRGESARREHPCVTLKWLGGAGPPVTELLWPALSGWTGARTHRLPVLEAYAPIPSGVPRRPHRCAQYILEERGFAKSHVISYLLRIIGWVECGSLLAGAIPWPFSFPKRAGAQLEREGVAKTPTRGAFSLHWPPKYPDRSCPC